VDVQIDQTRRQIRSGEIDRFFTGFRRDRPEARDLPSRDARRAKLDAIREDESGILKKHGAVGQMCGSHRSMQSPSEFQTTRAERVRKLGLRLEDFTETFHRSGGPGGQNVNKVSTAVTVQHGPTGHMVTAQDTRSQAQNRHLAWERLLDGIHKARLAARAAQKHEREKERRRNAKRPWGLKQRILDSKKKRGAVKKLRAKDW
jgi:protein subunit release factor B